MKKILWILYQPYKWLIFVPYLAVSTIFFATVAVILAFIANARIASFFGGVLWARLCAYMTPIRVKVRGRENVNKKQSYVIVSNHQSQYDIFVLYGWLGVDFKWIMKMELRKVPGIGIGCEKVGHIFIDRSNHQAAVESINAAKEKIVNGTSVIFFPEGTRSRDGVVGEFKKGAFKMALDLDLPILPVAIRGTKDILPSNTTNLFPGTAHMTILPPIDIKKYSDENIVDLMEKVQGSIISALNEDLKN